MEIHIKGAGEHNLKDVDVDFGDGLTVVTGVSGSGKTSLVFDTLYHEARRRFLDVFAFGKMASRLSPANVQSVTGVGPAIAVGQNLLNRNPLSTLATASGLHPFLRLLYTNFGERNCSQCGAKIFVLTEDEIVEKLVALAKHQSIIVYVPVLRQVQGSHRTLLKFLSKAFDKASLLVDGNTWNGQSLAPDAPHDIEVEAGRFKESSSASHVRAAVQKAAALGAYGILVKVDGREIKFSRAAICVECGSWFGELRPLHFHTQCPYCKGAGCDQCNQLGLHPQAASVYLFGLRLPDLLSLSVSEAHSLLAKADLPSSAKRLKTEILRRLEALETVGLGYITLDRSSPTLSRGESQRVRLAITLTSRLEDMLHVLDEPTIGQHPADVISFLPAFRNLAGPVVYVEHDRIAAAAADHAIDLGPGAGKEGGEVTFKGTPWELWSSNTSTGRYFSMQDHVVIPKSRSKPDKFLTIKGAHQHNLQHIDIKIPLERLTIITGVSGSGKSTLVEHVLVPSLANKTPTGCATIDGLPIKPILVDQSPIGRNPRSNPATYTKLSDIIRDLYSTTTGLSSSHFSFNRPEGACPTCKGMGATEAKMRFLPSVWIRCKDCEGQRFNEKVLAAKVAFGNKMLSIADFYELSISDVRDLFEKETRLPKNRCQAAQRVLRALMDIGLGYLSLGQSSPTLSGGEAQRVKLTKYLGRNKLKDRLIVLDEPSTGLHPQDLDGLLKVLDRLVRTGATIVVVEHNTDIVRAADWVIDLGPGAGPAGGEILYAGPLEGLLKVDDSYTRAALEEESTLRPKKLHKQPTTKQSTHISISNARANNLQGINVDIPKNALTVVTGVSGSGKSSLVSYVLETESRRRFLETLSLYERQGTREGPEALVDSITGLGVTLSVGLQVIHGWTTLPQFTRRGSVGIASELSHHLGVLLARLGERKCLNCSSKMRREKEWICPKCGAQSLIAKPRHFSTNNYFSNCPECTGIGSILIPRPEKLIIHPEKPLCKGAMYSPGYWPQTYLCKDQPIIAEIGKHYGFDPMTTPWREMSKEAQDAFLYGDGKHYTWTYQSKVNGEMKQSTWKWKGFYGGWVRNWDIQGTYTDDVQCPECKGAGLRPEYLAVTLGCYNFHQLSEMPLKQLAEVLEKVPLPSSDEPFAGTSLEITRQRLRFLLQVGLGYLHLNRPVGTLSAGEAQRIRLASLLGSGLTSLTILLDEPSRGMHPTELDALKDALLALRDEGNTVIVVEHDLQLIRAADHLIDLGPGSGTMGGKIVATGTPKKVAKTNTLTGQWLRGVKRERQKRSRRQPQGWLTIKGARGNNLRGDTVKIPLGSLVGICGVSGSGKSTLLIDTLGRALVRKSHSSSFAQEPVNPLEYESIQGKPSQTVIVDQSRKGIGSPSRYLGIHKQLIKIYADSDDAKALGIDEKTLSRSCKPCQGRGRIRIDMGFLPSVYEECETCKGTGYLAEAWDIRVKGVALPEVNRLTLDEVYELFHDQEKIAKPLDIARAVGLGYLQWHQPAFSLSGGEIQRLKITRELMKKGKTKTLYILDEPTVGQHMEDVVRLTNVLHKLVEHGHTVVIIEHHTHMLANCDWLIELGPEGGPKGGKVIATGTPEEVARMVTPTAPYIKEVLEVEQ